MVLSTLHGLAIISIFPWTALYSIAGCFRLGTLTHVIEGTNALDIPVSDLRRTVRTQCSRQWLFNKPFLVSERKLENAARVLASAAADEQERLARLMFTR